MTYRIADGHDEEANFADVTPQPRSPGILATERRYSLNRTPHEQALYTIWIYNSLTDAEYNSLLTQFGLSDANLSNDVTIRTTNNARSFVNKNATILLPEQGVDARREMAFWKDVSFYLTDLSDT